MTISPPLPRLEPIPLTPVASDAPALPKRRLLRILPTRLLAIAALASPALARADALTDRAARETPSLVALYKELHAAPELAFAEVKSAARLAAEARRAGFTVTERVGRTGVVAVLANGPGPTVLIRTDMDGLPVAEATGLPYASKAVGVGEDGKPTPVMHACGHDIHMSVWVGTARALAATRSQWSGTVMLVAQPAEEKVAGADAMLADGLYKRFGTPTHALALHDTSTLPAGHVGVTPGFALANVDSIDIVVRGVGAHGSTPHVGIDPVVIAARIVGTLQTLVSRETSALDPAVITVGRIVGGTRRNIIPDEVRMELTVRSYKPEVRARLLAGIRRVARAEAEAGGVPTALLPVVSEGDRSDATYNTPALADRLLATFRQRFGEARVAVTPSWMGAEDFGRFGATAKVPSAIFFLGATPRAVWDKAGGDASKIPGPHSARFAPDPAPTIQTGVEAMTAAALDILGKR